MYGICVAVSAASAQTGGVVLVPVPELVSARAKTPRPATPDGEPFGQAVYDTGSVRFGYDTVASGGWVAPVVVAPSQ